MYKTLSRLLILTLIAFTMQSNNWYAVKANTDTISYQLSVSIHGTDFTIHANRLYKKIGLKEDQLSTKVFDKALKGYMVLKMKNELQNERFLTILDFSKSSKERRLWLIDLKYKSLIFNELVAHGKNSGDEFATRFSNRHESRQSSLGFYVTGQPYNGKHKYSLKLNGLEPYFNSNAFSRGLVVHGANYVDEDIVENDQRIGRSFGCPAVSQKANSIIVSLIKGGSCLFIYHPNAVYNQKSKILNTDLFIPIEELNELTE
ncbi:MAG: hypothetical protein ACI83I_001651 [Bacteroidia bacterium]|jgi:hypothetical protein